MQMTRDVVRDEILIPESLRWKNLGDSDTRSDEILLAEMEPEIRTFFIQACIENMDDLSGGDYNLAIYSTFMMGISLGRRIESWSRENPDAIFES